MNATLSRWIASCSRVLAARAGSLESEDGQALVEYALIIVFIAIVAVTALQLLGASVVGALQNVVSDFP